MRLALHTAPPASRERRCYRSGGGLPVSAALNLVIGDVAAGEVCRAQVVVRYETVRVDGQDVGKEDEVIVPVSGLCEGSRREENDEMDQP